MSLIALAFAAQLAAPTRVLPVLSFPERGLDDSAAYLGYQTRLFRDASSNTVQVYLDRRADRVVHLWANAEDESLGFTARGAGGKVAALEWGDAGALVTRNGRRHTLEHALVARDARIDIGWFLLGSMRVERDFQYATRQKAPFADAPFRLEDIDRMFAALASLGDADRQAHLAMLGASSIDALRARLRPAVTAVMSGATHVVRVAQPALDGRDTLLMEFRTDPRRVTASVEGDSVTLRARTGARIPFSVRITTSGRALTPLGRSQIFTPDFLRFLRQATSGPDRRTPSARRLERQVRGLELLSSREKLMAGLPTYATYFGRDMLMSALMMRPIWRDEMSEAVIASVLRKLGPDGRVSHEEAMGGQAVREAASEYAAYVTAASRASGPSADSLRERARVVLRDIRRTRENYHMIDAEFQFPIYAARWLADASVPATRKRAFLLERADDGGDTRAVRLVRELALVARVTAPYAEQPVVANLVSFAPRDSGRWASQSWRDSGVGYAGGRYAMDVNAIWAPAALESVGRILDALRAAGIPFEVGAGTPLARYARDPAALRRAVDTWRGASSHFVVNLSATDVRAAVAARLAAMAEPDRRHWTGVLERTGADREPFSFLALALDGAGRPIPVANSDVATRLFLGDHELARSAPDAQTRADVLRDVRTFTRNYPVGLMIEGIGPAVASDAFATPTIWRDFDRDRYHGPRVVWGRENNLFLIGTMQRIADATGPRDAGNAANGEYVAELRSAVDRVLTAVEASGFHSELWSYEVRDGRVVPIRYGSGSDVQLWSTTDLVVAYQRARLQQPR